MDGVIRYIKFSGYYDKFGQWKKITNAISIHNIILNYLTKEREIAYVEDAENDDDKLNIYERNSKAWDFLIMSHKDITFGLVMQVNENTHEAWKDLIDKYELSK